MKHIKTRNELNEDKKLNLSDVSDSTKVRDTLNRMNYIFNFHFSLDKVDELDMDKIKHKLDYFIGYLENIRNNI
jgi:hypothetical protein